MKYRWIAVFSYAFILLHFISTAINASDSIIKTKQATPFVYPLNIHAEYKRLTVDDLGIVVIAHDKTNPAVEPSFKRIVLYSLDHQRNLQWITEDIISASKIMDSVVSTEAIYVLHEVFNLPDRRAISKFNRQDGLLVWREIIVGSENAVGQFIQVNEVNNTLSLSGEVDELIHIWWYDLNGNFIRHITESESPFTSGYGVFGLELLSDNSVVIASVENRDNAGAIQLKRINSLDETLFLYQDPADIVISSFITSFSLVKIAGDDFLISYAEENQDGVDRLNQIFINSQGDELFNISHEKLGLYNNEFGNHLKSLEDGFISVGQINNRFFRENEMQLFKLKSDGMVENLASYSFDQHSSSGTAIYSLFNSQNELFVIASISNPWPDPTSDTMYLQFNNNQQLCQEHRVSGSDFYAQLSAYNQNFYELRVVENNDVNELKVLVHPSFDCESNLIFADGFE